MAGKTRLSAPAGSTESHVIFKVQVRAALTLILGRLACNLADRHSTRAIVVKSRRKIGYMCSASYQSLGPFLLGKSGPGCTDSSFDMQISFMVRRCLAFTVKTGAS